MTYLASRFGAANVIRRDRPLTREELFRVVPSVFSENKHESQRAIHLHSDHYSSRQPTARRLSAVLCLSDPCS
jgi:hypothetical protein